MGYQVLKGVPDRPDVSLVRLREIKYKIDKKIFAKDRYKNTLSVKDVVKILEGPCRVRFQLYLLLSYGTLILLQFRNILVLLM